MLRSDSPVPGITALPTATEPRCFKGVPHGHGEALTVDRGPGGFVLPSPAPKGASA